MSLTAANASIYLGVVGLFATPQQIQGFAADDIFDVEQVENVETLFGVDGVLSAGFVFKEKPWSIMLQADSPSNAFFDALISAQTTAKDVFTLFGTISLPGIGADFTMVKGFLTSYAPLPAARKILQPRKFTIKWQDIQPAPTGA